MSGTVGRIGGGGAALAVALAVGACAEPSGLDSIEDAALRDMALVAADETLEAVSTWALPFGFGAGAQAVPEGDGPGPRFGRPGGHAGLGADGSGTINAFLPIPSTAFPDSGALRRFADAFYRRLALHGDATVRRHEPGLPRPDEASAD